MLDSLIGTTICIPLTSTSVISAWLLPDAPDEPPDDPLDPDEPAELLEELDDDPLDPLPVAEPLPDTVLPTAADTNATVPGNGAYSFVSFTACCALLTAACAD